jgi:hypothetical protein
MIIKTGHTDDSMDIVAETFLDVENGLGHTTADVIDNCNIYEYFQFVGSSGTTSALGALRNSLHSLKQRRESYGWAWSFSGQY